MARLRADVKFYVRAAYAQFHETGNRPTARVMERKLAQAGYDYRKTALEARRLFGDGNIPIEEWLQEVRLPLRALEHVPQAAANYDLFVKGIPIMADVYQTRTPEPAFTAEDLRSRGWAKDEIERFARTLDEEYILTGNSNWQSWSEWSYVIKPNILDYTDVRTGKAYLAKRLKLADKSKRAFGRGWGFEEEKPQLIRRIFGYLARHVREIVVLVLVGVAVAWLVAELNIG